MSYGSADRERAQLIAKSLEDAGWTVWWDRHLPAGKAFDRSLSQELEKARCVIVLWSKHANNSDWVLEEAHEGLRRKILVPVAIEGTDIPFGFRRLQAVQLQDWTGNKNSPPFCSLKSAISATLDHSLAENVEPQQKKPENKGWDVVGSLGTVVRALGGALFISVTSEVLGRYLSLGPSWAFWLAAIFGGASFSFVCFVVSEYWVARWILSSNLAVLPFLDINTAWIFFLVTVASMICSVMVFQRKERAKIEVARQILDNNQSPANTPAVQGAPLEDHMPPPVDPPT